MSKNIVYGLVDPFTKEIRYVGKSTSGFDRPREHFKPFNLMGTTHKINWIKSVLNQNKRPEITVIEECQNGDDLFAAEAFWINYYKLNGNITNATDGFEGSFGYKHKEETINKISQLATGRNKGKPLPVGMNVAKEHIVINGIEYRNCSRCELDKEISNYGWDKKQNRFQSYCSQCNTEYKREYSKLNPAPTLSEAEFNASRLPGAIAGGQASKTPERRKQVSERQSKAIIATNLTTGEVLTFPSALKAKEAGFQNSNIGVAIKLNKPYKGFSWTFAA